MVKHAKRKFKIDFSTVYTIAFIALIWGLFGREFLRRQMEKHYLKKTFITKAVIINERNYYGNSPVTHEFSLSYSFSVNGKTYKGNSQDSKYKIGDTVSVEVSVSHPEFSRVHN